LESGCLRHRWRRSITDEVNRGQKRSAWPKAWRSARRSAWQTLQHWHAQRRAACRDLLRGSARNVDALIQRL